MKTVMMIDDDQDFLKTLQSTFTREGFRVLVAANGVDGADLVARESPDIILMGMTMPGQRLETADYLKSFSRFSGVPVMFLTGIPAENMNECVGEININGRVYPVILRTTDVEEIVRKVARHLATAEKKTMKVLVVDDSPTDAHLVRRALEHSTRRVFRVKLTASLKEADEHLKLYAVDAIVLDLGLPDSDKANTIKWMQGIDLPVVVITGDGDEATLNEVFRNGAQDFLVKGDFNEREVVRSVLHSVERVMLRREVMVYRQHFDRLVQERVSEVLRLEKSQ